MDKKRYIGIKGLVMNTSATLSRKEAMAALGLKYKAFMARYRSGDVPVCFRRPRNGSWPRGGRVPRAALERLIEEGVRQPL